MINRLLHRSDEAPAPVTTQVPIEGISNGMIKTNNGYVMVLTCNAVNFRLMSEDARSKLWSGYRSFLNVLSLGFPIQFHIQVRKQTIDDIRKHFDEVVGSQPSDRRRALAEAQRDFVINTVRESAVVSRSFYIVIPYLPNYSADIQTISIFRQALIKNRKRSEETTLEIASKQLATRREQVVTQLKKLG